jgi:hypothetical protein
MSWTHPTVYQALVERGGRVKSSSLNRYVTLYDQKNNCAILYAPNSNDFAKKPFHTNDSRPDWRKEVFDRLKGAVEKVSEDRHKGKQNFVQYAVLDWTQFAEAVGITNDAALSKPHAVAGISPVALVGAGFGDPTENKLVENAAVQAVTKDYERDGWLVRSVERDKCGFDLECSKEGEIEHVEVKGVRGTDQSFIITSGEVRQAEMNPNFVLTVVTEALSPSPKLTKHSGAEFGRRFDLSAIQYRAVLKP